MLTRAPGIEPVGRRCEAPGSSSKSESMLDLRQYLGDAVYVDLDNGMIRLTTEDGVSVTNEIFLEPFVYEALVKWVERLR